MNNLLKKGNASELLPSEASFEKSPIAKKGTIVNNSTVVPANSQPVFNFGDNQVRLVVRDGEPWFVANDICVALGYANSRKAVADHLDDDERMTVTTSDGQNFDSNQSLESFDKASTQIVRSTSGGKRGGARMMTIINESGLYALVLRSRKPEARKFAKWVTREVLPSIRKTGQYQQPAAQANPAVDYDRISPAQAQDLREIVQAIVEAKIQGHSETWARFQRKFKVNSYLQLPASRHLEARQYLIAKLPSGYAGDLFEEEPKAQPMDLALVESAMTAANTVAAQVQKEAFMAMVKHQQLDRCRFQLSIGYGATGEPQVKPIEDGACVATIPQMARMIETPGAIQVESQDLMNLAKACMNRLATRLGGGGQCALA